MGSTYTVITFFKPLDLNRSNRQQKVLINANILIKISFIIPYLWHFILISKIKNWYRFSLHSLLLPLPFPWVWKLIRGAFWCVGGFDLQVAKTPQVYKPQKSWRHECYVTISWRSRNTKRRSEEYTRVCVILGLALASPALVPRWNQSERHNGYLLFLEFDIILCVRIKMTDYIS